MFEIRGVLKKKSKFLFFLDIYLFLDIAALLQIFEPLSIFVIAFISFNNALLSSYKTKGFQDLLDFRIQ